VEDWAGAGLICARLAELGLELSAEARVAAAAWNGPEVLAGCVSARELRARGFADDVALALEVDVSDRVPSRVAGGRLFVGRICRET
jgi:2-phosphosulfolactate phosphatase